MLYWYPLYLLLPVLMIEAWYAHARSALSSIAMLRAPPLEPAPVPRPAPPLCPTPNSNPC
jgi:hypothetical protein